jgi:hypothetical protein
MIRELCQFPPSDPRPDGSYLHRCAACGRVQASRVPAGGCHRVCAVQPPPAPGLGDWLAKALARVGLTKERWGRWRSGPQFGGGLATCRLFAADPLGRKCACERCAARQETVNRWGWRAVGLLSRPWPRTNRTADSGGTAAGSPDQSRTGATESPARGSTGK